MYIYIYRIARRDKKAFLSDQCKEIEKNNRMGKTRDHFKKIRPPGDLPHPGTESTSPALAGRFFTTEPPGKPQKSMEEAKAAIGFRCLILPGISLSPGSRSAQSQTGSSTLRVAEMVAGSQVSLSVRAHHLSKQEQPFP